MSVLEHQQDLLVVKDLEIAFATDGEDVSVVSDVNFEIKQGEVLGLVGESGCGKSVTAMSLISLLPSPPSKRKKGEILLDGRDLASLSYSDLLKVRGSEVGFIFQEPMSSLNPVLTIGFQLVEALRLHRKVSKLEATQQAISMLQLVGVSGPELRMKQYAFELSGGMRQRVMIAMALMCSPRLLIADEPTTALDVTIQAQILDLLRSLRERLGMAILLITHDLGVVAETCDRVLVMYAGRIVESGSVAEVFTSAKRPYTAALLKSTPHSALRQEHLPTIPGIVPAPGERGRGCAFEARCSRALERCEIERPSLSQEVHSVECWNPES